MGKAVCRRGLLQGLGSIAGGALLAGCTNTGAVGEATAASTSAAGVQLGIDRLAADGFAQLRGKRVGFITNQTSVDRTGTMSRVVLQRGLGRDLVALFGPEHGLDTRVRAGEHVPNARDAITGLTAYSLYGQTRKPTPAMMAGVDVMVFDIQDIGVRSYTYISTMALAMEACGEAGKDFVVLDRPNPMGGLRVMGPPLEDGFTSFVSQVPVPYVHGLTIGELARMIIAKGWIKANPRLTVIPMLGWQRAMNWAGTELDWVATSPNIPRWQSPFYCAATGILGELREVDIGIGGDKPFQVAAGRGIDAEAFARQMSAANMPGVTFKPYTSTTKPGFGGVELEIDPDGSTDLMALGMMLCVEVVRAAGGEPLRATPAASINLLNKVYGSDALVTALRAGTPWQALTEGWPASIARFMTDRQEFLLYS